MINGIRILDKKEKIVTIKLHDILHEIPNGNLLYWSILYLQSMGDLGEDKPIPEFEKQIIESNKGYFIAWEDLNILSKKFWELMDIIIIGCKDKILLHRYKTDREMYETCDIVIVKFDSSFWEVFSKDEELINRLAKKYKKIEFLNSDFPNK